MLWMRLSKEMKMNKQRKNKLILVLIYSYIYIYSSDELVDQVLNELNITMANQIPCKLFEIEYQ
jgi:hypothetical protein